MKTVELETTGMHCRSCAMVIELAVSDLEGVESVRSDAIGGTTVVTYDPDVVGASQVAEAIVEAGYGVRSLVQEDE